MRRLRTSYWGCSTAAVRVLLHGGFAEGVGYQVAVGLLSASYFSSVGVVPPRRMGELTPGLCASDRLGGCVRSDMRPRAPRYLLAAVYCAFTAACYEHRLAADCSIVPHRPRASSDQPPIICSVYSRVRFSVLTEKALSESRGCT